MFKKLMKNYKEVSEKMDSFLVIKEVKSKVGNPERKAKHYEDMLKRAIEGVDVKIAGWVGKPEIIKNGIYAELIKVLSEDDVTVLDKLKAERDEDTSNGDVHGVIVNAKNDFDTAKKKFEQLEQTVEDYFSANQLSEIEQDNIVDFLRLTKIEFESTIKSIQKLEIVYEEKHKNSKIMIEEIYLNILKEYPTST